MSCKGQDTLAEPSKVLALLPIVKVRAVCNLVAVAALPVILESVNATCFQGDQPPD